MSFNAKRKRSNHHSSTRLPSQAQTEAQQIELERSLARMHVQAYEAEISRGPAAWDRAQMLEAPYGSTSGRGLIALIPSQQMAGWGGQEDDVFSLGASSSSTYRAPTSDGITKWVDRLLLDPVTLARQDQGPLSTASTPSSSGWSDLPEDADETFEMSAEEAEDYHRDKRRRVLEEARERRLREREAEDAEAGAGESLVDVEPSPETLTLMQRTAAHLVAAANPAQLEMRILANHGSDVRFAFMRAGGRSWNVWLKIKQEAEDKVKKEKEEKKKGIGALASYSSDEEVGEPEGLPAGPPPPPSNPPPEFMASPPPPPTAPLSGPNNEEDTLKAMRRDKARRWLEQRRSGDAG